LPIILSSIALSILGAAIKGATSFSSQENHTKKELASKTKKHKAVVTRMPRVTRDGCWTSR
jgi:hypothetical protein